MKFKEIYALREGIKGLSREELEKAFLDVSDEWLHVSDDADYLRAIVEGSWPDADDCIKEYRLKAAIE